MRLIPILALITLIVSPSLAEDEQQGNIADTFIECGALYEIMAELEAAEGRSISARDLRALGRQAQAAARAALADQEAFAAAGDERSEEEITGYIATRRQAAIEHFLAILENLDNDTFEASAERCMGTIEAQKAVLEATVE